jgi:MFS family permease
MNVVGRLTDRYQRLPLFRVLGGITIVVTLVIANLPPCPIWVATLALSAFMVFASGRIVPAQAMLLGAAEPRARGAFMSLNTAVQHLGTALAPLLAAAFITKEGNKIEGFPAVGVVAAICAVISLILAGTLRTAAVVVTPQPEPQKEVEQEPVVAA